MNDYSYLQKIVEMYAWMIAGIIMIFVISIARFYEKKFKVNVFFYLYFIPIAVIFIVPVHYFFYNTPISEEFEVASSILSAFATYHLYKKMTGGDAHN